MGRWLWLGLAGLAATAAADVEIQFSDGSYGLVSGERVFLGDEEGGALYEPGAERLVFVDHADRTWMNVSAGFADDMRAQMDAQMQKMLAELPPEQREQVKQQMQAMTSQMQTSPPETTARRTGNRDQVAGYDCEVVEIVDADGNVQEVACVASADELGVAEDDFEALAAATRFMIETMVGSGELQELDFGALGGIPIRSSDGGTLVSVDTGAVESSRLAVPADYRETTVEDALAQ